MTKNTSLIISLSIFVCLISTGCIQEKETAARMGKNGVVSFGDIVPVEKSIHMTTKIDDSDSYNWSTSKGMILSTDRDLEYIRYEVLADDDEPRTITVYGVKDSQFGRYRSAVNDKPTGQMIDFYGRKGEKTKPSLLGTFEPKDGKFSIVLICVGVNPKSIGEKHGAGLDYTLFTKPKE